MVPTEGRVAMLDLRTVVGKTFSNLHDGAQFSDWKRKPPVNRWRARSLIAPAFLASLSLACQGPGREQRTAQSAANPPVESRCEMVEPQAPLDWVAPPARRSEKSHLEVELKVPQSWLAKELEKELPRRLARERDRPIGAPGRVTFDVTRGRLRFSETGHSVSVHVPIQIDLSVCKPFAGSCITYGRCSPRYQISATLSKKLTREGELPPLQLSHRTVEGCRIGIDVTPMITSIVEEQLEDAQRQAQGRVPQLAPLLAAATQSIPRPLAVAPTLCLDAQPKNLGWSPLSLAGENVSARAALELSLSPVHCDAELGALSPPRLRNEPSGRPSRIRLPELIPLAELERAVTKTLARTEGEPLQVDLKSISPGKRGLLLDLSLGGTHCGGVLFPMETRVKAGRLVLTPLEVAGTELPDELRAELQQRLSPPLPIELEGRELVGSLQVLLRAGLPLMEDRVGSELVITLPELSRSEARPVASGVQVTHVLSGPVVVQPGSPASRGDGLAP